MGLAEDMKSITEGITDSYDSRMKETRGRIRDVQKTLRDFASDRKHMGAGQAAALVDFVGTLRAATGGMIKGFQKDHKAMAEALKGGLAHGEAARMKDFKGMLGNIQKGIKEIENYVAQKLKEFNDAHAEMSEQQKKDLANYVSGIVNEVKKFLGEYASEMAKARAAWQGMAASMSKSRNGGVMPRIEAEEKVTTVEEAVEKKGKKRGRKKGKKNS